MTNKIKIETTIDFRRDIKLNPIILRISVNIIQQSSFMENNNNKCLII